MRHVQSSKHTRKMWIGCSTTVHSVGCPRDVNRSCKLRGQTAFFKAATQKALTTVFAGFALTITTLPKTSFLPALVAGFRRVLTIATPGIVNFPFFFTSVAATTARLLSTFVHSDFFNSVAVARASAIAVLVMALTPAFISADAFALPLGAIGNTERQVKNQAR